MGETSLGKRCPVVVAATPGATGGPRLSSARLFPFRRLTLTRILLPSREIVAMCTDDHIVVAKFPENPEPRPEVAKYDCYLPPGRIGRSGLLAMFPSTYT